MSQEEAENIRSFTYELAELVLEAGIVNYKNNNHKQTYEQLNETGANIEDRLGNGGRNDETGNAMEKGNSTPQSTTTT